MKLHIRHRTTHEYASPVNFSNHKVFLRPLDSHRRRVVSFEVETTPESTQRWVRDTYGNVVLACNFGLTESAKLEFVAKVLVEIDEDNPYDFILESYATVFPFEYEESDKVALQAFMGREPKPGALKVLGWARITGKRPNSHESVVQFLSDLNAVIFEKIAYVRRDEEGIQDPDTTLSLGTGSCRDVAVLFIELVRQLGFAARFVSGYLFDPPVGSDGDHIYNRAVGSMHAWAEVYLPGAGWKGFDPTNGILANGFFVPCAVSHDPGRIDPVQGTYYSDHPVSSNMSVELEIEDIDHVQS